MPFWWPAILEHTRTDRVQAPILARYAAPRRQVDELQCPKGTGRRRLRTPEDVTESKKTGPHVSDSVGLGSVNRDPLAQRNPTQDMEMQVSLERRESHAHLDA